MNHNYLLFLQNAGIVRFVPSLIPVSSQFQNISYELELPRDSNIDADSYVNRSRPVTIAILDPTATIVSKPSLVRPAILAQDTLCMCAMLHGLIHVHVILAA